MFATGGNASPERPLAARSSNLLRLARLQNLRPMLIRPGDDNNSAVRQAVFSSKYNLQRTPRR